MLPGLFLAHGVPLMALSENDYTRFVRGLSLTLPEPKAVVVILADGDSGALTIGAADGYDGIRLEYGLPDELLDTRYPAKGDRQLASDIGIMSIAQGIPYQFDVKRRLDYRAWAVLHWLYPRAEVPVVTLTVNGKLVPEEQYRIGRMLAPLRERNVLLIGCGSTGHQLRKLSWDAVKPERFAVRFDEWLTEQVSVWNTEALFDYATRAPYAAEAVLKGGEKHLAPLFAAMGTADAEKEAEKLHQSYVFGCLSLNAWMFGG